jgi:hypothetical protein
MHAQNYGLFYEDTYLEMKSRLIKERLLVPLLAADQEYGHRGYATFFHGQTWKHNLWLRFHTDLYALQNDRKHSREYIFPHIESQEHMSQVAQNNVRERIMRNGLKSDDDRNQVIFLNAALGGNVGDIGSSSMCYFLRNVNYGSYGKKFTWGKLFAMHGIGDLYVRYRAECKEIERLHEASSTYGNMLFVAVPEAMLKDYVFVSCWNKRRDHKIDRDVRELYRSQTNADLCRDRNEFCLVLTDKAMDPNGGIVIKSFHAAEPEEYAQFQKKYEELMAKIKRDLAMQKR